MTSTLELPKELLAVTDTPHWTIGRARAVLAAEAARLSGRLPSFAAHFERLRDNPWKPWKPNAYLAIAVGRLRPREVNALKRFVLVAKLLVALEAGACPPRRPAFK